MLLINLNRKIQKLILQLLQEERKIETTTKYLNQGNFTDLRNYRWNIKEPVKYDQVFMEKHGFIANLSILDLLFNLGPESNHYLHNLSVNIDI